MSFESSLKAHLAGDATVAARVGERIHPVLLPEGTTKPAIVYGRVGVTDQIDLDSGDGSLQEVRVQVDVWAATHSMCIEVAEAVRLRMQTATIASNNFRLGAAFAQDDYDSEAKLYRVILDFTCWYRTS